MCQAYSSGDLNRMQSVLSWTSSPAGGTEIHQTKDDFRWELQARNINQQHCQKEN